MASNPLPAPPDYPGDAGDEQPDDNSTFSPQVRYAGADVVCANCSYFTMPGSCDNQAVIAEQGGKVDAGGRCEEFEAQGSGQGQDELASSLAATKPFGPSAQGISNS